MSSTTIRNNELQQHQSQSQRHQQDKQAGHHKMSSSQPVIATSEHPDRIISITKDNLTTTTTAVSIKRKEKSSFTMSNDTQLQLADEQAGSLSATSSSSISSQGSIQGSITKAQEASPTTGHRCNVDIVPPQESSNTLKVKETEKEKMLHHHDRKTSTTSTALVKNTILGVKVVGAEKSGKKGGGRPRSNSLPFNFHSKSPSKTSPNSKSGQQLRRGKWTVEEEAYVARVIHDFNSGYLNAPPGTTLRTYLSDKLNCDPMRITKKFTGDSCIGKRVFHPAVRCSNNAALIDKAQAELDALERRWRKRLELQQKEVAKKQAASAVAAAAAVSGRILNGKALRNSGNRAVVAQTASWLDRANAILAQNHPERPTYEQERELVKSSSDEVEDEMKEVERLIHEGPIIQQSSAGFPTLLQQKSFPSTTSPASKIDTTQSSGSSSKRKVSEETHNFGKGSSSMLQSHKKERGDNSHHSQFVDKRMRRSFSHNNIQDHEDAVTLMGFLSSVRQAAALSPNPIAK